jgi:AraC-like DNA-binding protein
MPPNLLDELGRTFTGEELFDHLLDIVYFIKNKDGQYLVVNQTLVRRCRLSDKRSLIGKTAIEVLGSPLGESFTQQDQKVLSTGHALLSQLELHIHLTGEVGWCLTTKLPLRNKSGTVIGLVGVSQDLRIPDTESSDYAQLSRAIRLVMANLSERHSVRELADYAGLSRYQLDRRMRCVFGITAGQWLTKVRVDRAQSLLHETEDAISAIAYQTGYSDQSAFSRVFRKATGLTPLQFRQTRVLERD